MKTTSEYLQLLKQFKDSKGMTYGIKKIGLFGSVARGEHHEGSDVDVCFEGVPKVFFAVGFISPVAADFTIKICPGATGKFSGFCRFAAKRSLTFIKRVIVDKLTVIPAFFSRL